MDNVTAIILTTWSRGADGVARLNERMGFPEGQGLRCADDPRAGGPWLGGDSRSRVAALGAFRDLDLDALVMALRNLQLELQWPPDEVQLFVRAPGRDTFVEILPWETPPNRAWLDGRVP